LGSTKGVILMDKSMNYYLNHCYKCEKEIKDNDKCAFSIEFDCYICEKCYRKIMNGNMDDIECKIMKREWS
jgi:hypothetical protein